MMIARYFKYLAVGSTIKRKAKLSIKKNSKHTQEYFLYLAILKLTSQWKVASYCTSLWNGLSARSSKKSAWHRPAGWGLSIQWRNSVQRAGDSVESTGEGRHDLLWVNKESKARSIFGGSGQRHWRQMSTPRNELLSSQCGKVTGNLGSCLVGLCVWAAQSSSLPFRDSDSVGCLLGWTLADLEHDSRNKAQSGAF